MSVRFSCSCGRKMKVADERIGKKIMCPDCGNPVRVPEAGAVVVERGKSSTAADPSAGKSSKEKKRRKRFVVVDDEVQEEITDPDRIDVRTLAFFVLLGVPAVLVAAYVVYAAMSWIMTTSPDLPPLGEVSGVVTLDGEPLPSASVVFKPVAGEEAGSQIAASFARSDAEGNYTLIYSGMAEGAALGDHKVEVSALDENGRERVPFIYNARTRLVMTVEPGSNNIDLNLKSQ